jgi:hypothetical protein
MVLGTLLIIAMTAIYQSTTDTTISGVNQQSQAMMAAAEAGLELGLANGASGSFAQLGITSLSGVNLEASRVDITEERTREFSTPRLEDGEQYTFYLSDYPTLDNPYGGKFEVYYESELADCTETVLEFTMVYDQGSDDTLETAILVSDAGDQVENVGTDDIFGSAIADMEIDGHSYRCKTEIFDTELYPDVKFVLVKAYLAPTRVAFYDVTPATVGQVGGADFPPQGKTITSTARANAGVLPTVVGLSPTPVAQSGLTRTAQIFQSYPQIPVELWTTSF